MSGKKYKPFYVRVYPYVCARVKDVVTHDGFKKRPTVVTISSHAEIAFPFGWAGIEKSKSPDHLRRGRGKGRSKELPRHRQ